MNNASVMNQTNLLKLLLSASFLFAFIGFSTAQMDTPSGLLTANDWTLEEGSKDDLSLFYDADNQIYYIDFETISLNLTTIEVKDNANNMVISDHVADLPVNTIYELDCSRLISGDYTIELHAYTKVLKKQIKISAN